MATMTRKPVEHQWLGGQIRGVWGHIQRNGQAERNNWTFPKNRSRKNQSHGGALTWRGTSQDPCESNQCTMCCLYSIFSSQPNEVGHDLTPHNCDIIQHILIPTRSVARKTLLWTFSWASNSKFEIFLELYPCSNYRILAFFTPISVWIHGNSIIPPYHTQGDFGYRGILLYKQHIVHCGKTYFCSLPQISHAGWQWSGYNRGPGGILQGPRNCCRWSLTSASFNIK